jgi:hypothetical protein
MAQFDQVVFTRYLYKNTPPKEYLFSINRPNFAPLYRIVYLSKIAFRVAQVLSPYKKKAFQELIIFIRLIFTKFYKTSASNKRHHL